MENSGKSAASYYICVMGKVRLPINSATGQPAILPDSQRYTIIGSNGAGKSRFMEEVIARTSGPIAIISAVDNTFPLAPAPELEERLQWLSHPDMEPAFQTISHIWSDLFKGSDMTNCNGEILFSNETDSNLFRAGRLSRGEKITLWFLTAIAGAPRGSTVFVDTPTLFLHPTVSLRLWDEIEHWRHDCRFVYDTSDPLFSASRPGTIPVWIKSYRKNPEAWEYSIVQEEDQSDEFLLDLLGSRRPVMFIEGDVSHSIDYRLYSSVFSEYTIKPVGSCNKVIEATRTFSSLNRLHRLECHGLVDRDRRTDAEVAYLRQKNIMVPEVAEIENIFLDEEILAIMARIRHRNPATILAKTRKEVMDNFRRNLEQQALQHTRHRMKRDVERKIDARFSCITALELHIKSLICKLKPRENYSAILKGFRELIANRDYAGILKVFNDKTLFRHSCAIPLLGFSTPEQYIEGVLASLRGNADHSRQLRQAIKKLFTPPEETLKPSTLHIVNLMEEEAANQKNHLPQPSASKSRHRAESHRRHKDINNHRNSRKHKNQRYGKKEIGDFTQ